MGKMKIGIYFYLVADILAKAFQKCLLSSPLPNVSFLSKPLILIGCHGNRKAKFWGTNHLFRSHKGDEAETVHNISLYKKMFFIDVANVLWLLWHLLASTDL